MTDTADPAPQALAPLWMDDDVRQAVYKLTRRDSPNDITWGITEFQAEQLLFRMRDDWAADRAALTKRVEELEAQLDIAKSQVRAAPREAGQK